MRDESNRFVMAALVAAIYRGTGIAWMAGTDPAMTEGQATTR
jgi:hypothetical protein